MEVGLSILILFAMCATIRGSSPSLEKVEKSSGALLGFACAAGAERGATCSIFGLDVNSEDIIWEGREAGAAARSWPCSSYAVLGSFRCRLAGRGCAA